MTDPTLVIRGSALALHRPAPWNTLESWGRNRKEKRQMTKRLRCARKLPVKPASALPSSVLLSLVPVEAPARKTHATFRPSVVASRRRVLKEQIRKIRRAGAGRYAW